MITLQYLQELGTFTLQLIQDLKEQKSEFAHKNFTVRNNGSGDMVIANNKIILFVITDSTLEDQYMISVNKRMGQNLTLVKPDLINYIFDLKKYSTVSFEEDWFALCTALQDEEIIELYLAHLVQNMMIKTCRTDRILFNAPLLHEYYQNEQHKLH